MTGIDEFAREIFIIDNHNLTREQCIEDWDWFTTTLTPHNRIAKYTDAADKLRAAGYGHVQEMKQKMDDENPHWDAFDVYVNSGNMDEQHRKIFFAYTDGYVSKEYMTSQLSTGMGHVPCDCDEEDDFQFSEFDDRPACEHCNRKSDS